MKGKNIQERLEICSWYPPGTAQASQLPLAHYQGLKDVATHVPALARVARRFIAGERLEGTFHWHWEIHPRLRVIAGLERATALAVNPAAPEYAAEVLRSHLDR